MRIAIIDLDTPPHDLEAAHGNFGDMFIEWLQPAIPEAHFSRIPIGENGEGMPKAGEFDAFLVSGSRHGVYDKRPWMAPLKTLILDAASASIPVAGVCFGHQILAETHGGRVIKSPGGWVLGNMDYRLTDAGEQRFGEESFDVLAFHQDQVVEVPPAARVLLGHDRCPIAALEYDAPALSVQFHPEFTIGFMRDLVESHRGQLPDEFLDAGLSRLVPSQRSQSVATAFANFYRRWANPA